MRITRIVAHRLRSLFRRSHTDDALDREIDLHIEQLTRQNIVEGMSESEARTAALREFGAVTQTQEQCRDARRVSFIEDLAQDLTYAGRLLIKSPAFTLTAVLSLALGIGANTAIFSLVQKVILELLPIRDPQSLVRVSRRTLTQTDSTTFSYLFFRELQTTTHLPFDGFLAYSRIGNRTMLTEPGAEPVAAEVVSGNYFDLLGVRPALGRLLTADDDRTPGGHPVVVLSHKFWQWRFGGDPSILNQTIRLNNYPFTILGVSAGEFDGLDPGFTPDVRVPVTMERQLGYSGGLQSALTNRGSQWLVLFGRLKPEVSYSQASDALQTILARNLETHGQVPRTDYERRLRASERMQLFAGAQGMGGARRRFEQALWALAAIVGAVLLLACVNIAHLLLARASAREREFSVRIAIGARRGRLVRQLLTESLLLAFAGGALGLAIAHALSRVLVSLVVSDRLHSTLEAPPNPLLLAFNFAVALAAGVLFGLAPALRASRPSLVTGLKGVHSGRAGRLTGRHLLISLQVAVSVVLLAGAGLFLRTVRTFQTMDLGFQPENVLQFGLDPVGYPAEQVHAFYARVRERVASLPGVRAVAVGRQRLVGGGRWGSGIAIEGRTPRENDLDAYRDAVSSGYFATVGMPLIMGREFTNADHATSQKVAIVNQAFARYFFSGQNPLGKRIGPLGRPDQVIVGVVKDSKYQNLREPQMLFWYTPYTQMDPKQFRGLTLSVRTAAEPAPMVKAIRREITAFDKNMAVFGISTVKEQVNASMAIERLLATLSTFFAGLAALLAAIGLFGVLSYSVARREREIGIRIALGARPAEAAWTIVRDIAGFTALGLAFGLAAAFSLTSAIEKLLFGIKPADPVAITGACAVMALTAAVAAFLPARRAASIQPAVAFRAE